MSDKSPEKEDNAKLESDRNLAQTALNNFNRKNYVTCIENLNQLEQSIGNNSKLEHNKAIAEFYQSELRNYKLFDEKLTKIIGQVTTDTITQIKDIQECPIYFSKALVLFHLRQPKAALKILIAILLHMCNLDDILVQRVGVLAINILLNTNQPKKADALIKLIEQRLGIVVESFSDDEDETELSIDQLNEKKLIKSLTEFKWMFRLYKLRTHIFCRKTVIIPDEMSAELLVLKGHFHLFLNDYQMAAKQLCKEFRQPLPSTENHGEDYHTVIGNNMGLIHFHVKHYAMAVKFFQNALTADRCASESVGETPQIHCIGATKRPEILYNLGVALLYLQRPKEAFECLLVPLNYYHNNPRLWLRLSEACIMVHKQTLKEKENRNIVSSVIGSGTHRKYVLEPNPIKHVSDERESFAIPSPNLEFAALCLRNALTLIEFFSNDFNNVNDAHASTSAAAAAAAATTTTTSSGGAATASTSATLADQINNASSSSSTIQPEVIEEWSKIQEKSQCNPSKPLNRNTYDKLKCAILTAFSYVQICLGEYILALKYAQELLKLTYLPDAYAMLGHLYCAESLIMLDRLIEARKYLEPKFITDLKEDDFIYRGSAEWNVNTLEKAQAIMAYNLAVICVLQGDNETATNILRNCKNEIVLTYMKRLRMYMELQAGNIKNCKLLIQHDTPQYS